MTDDHKPAPSMDFFADILRSLSRNHGDKPLDNDRTNRIIRLAGEIEAAYKGMEDGTDARSDAP